MSNTEFFVCGVAGEKDEQGLPEFIIVAPTYGVDLENTKLYKRVDDE